MTAFAFLSNNAFLKAPPAVRRHALSPWPASPGTARSPTGPARASARAPSARPATCCATRSHPHFDVCPDGRLGDAGDLPLPNTSLARDARGDAAAWSSALIRAHHMVWLGGDHSITLPLLRAYRARLGRPLAVIHFDAHCDTWEDHFGEPSGHGTWVYEAIQEGLVVRECFTQLGIRSAGAREAREYVRDQGGLIFTARDLRGLDSPAQLAPVLGAIRAAAGRPRPPAGLPEPGHRLPRPGLRARHRHARTGRHEHQPGAQRCSRNWPTCPSSAWTASRSRRPTTTPN